MHIIFFYLQKEFELQSKFQSFMSTKKGGMEVIVYSIYIVMFFYEPLTARTHTVWYKVSVDDKLFVNYLSVLSRWPLEKSWFCTRWKKFHGHCVWTCCNVFYTTGVPTILVCHYHIIIYVLNVHRFKCT